VWAERTVVECETGGASRDQKVKKEADENLIYTNLTIEIKHM
jgi:hypothetical protein